MTITTSLLAATLLVAPMTGGSDAPIPYTIDERGITLPGDARFEEGDHVNIRFAPTGGGDTSVGVHLEASSDFVGGASIPWGAFGIDVAAGFCLTWAQLSDFNQHFGEGGQAPYCEPAVEQPPAEVLQVGFYLYKKLDPARPATWDNSGAQTLIAAQPGAEWFTSYPGLALPLEVCGDDWAYQQDKVRYVETTAFAWPATITYPVSGFGPELYDSKHGVLAELVNVPECVVEEPPVEEPPVEEPPVVVTPEPPAVVTPPVVTETPELETPIAPVATERRASVLAETGSEPAIALGALWAAFGLLGFGTAGLWIASRRRTQ